MLSKKSEVAKFPVIFGDRLGRRLVFVRKSRGIGKHKRIRGGDLVVSGLNLEISEKLLNLVMAFYLHMLLYSSPFPKQGPT